MSEVCVVELRQEVEGMIMRKIRHVASNFEKAMNWIHEHSVPSDPDTSTNKDYWYAVWEQDVDHDQMMDHPEYFVSKNGNILDSQPVDHDADARRAEQSGLSYDARPDQE
jgi:hypothetical protein